jgi:hypothetical protein
MLKVKKLEYQKSGFYGFFKFLKAKTIFFAKKTPWLNKRGIQGLFISKNRKSQFSAVFEL